MTPALSLDVKKALLPSPRGRTVYVAVGNPLRGDDGVADYIADNLRVGRKDVVIVRAGDRPESIIDEAVGARPAKVVFIDAADFGGEAGKVRPFDSSCIPAPSLSTHRFPFSITATVLEEDTGAEIAFIGIQARQANFGSTIGEPLKRSADAIVDFLNFHFRG